MKDFGGFPANMQFTPVPNLFMNALMPGMDSPELKTMLYIFQAIYLKKGAPRFASLSELLGNPALMSSMQCEGRMGAEAVKTALGKAVERGAIIDVEVTQEGKSEHLYFLNTSSDRTAVARIRAGELRLPQIEAVKSAEAPAEK